MSKKYTHTHNNDNNRKKWDDINFRIPLTNRSNNTRTFSNANLFLFHFFFGCDIRLLLLLSMPNVGRNNGFHSIQMQLYNFRISDRDFLRMRYQYTLLRWRKQQQRCIAVESGDKNDSVIFLYFCLIRCASNDKTIQFIKAISIRILPFGAEDNAVNKDLKPKMFPKTITIVCYANYDCYDSSIVPTKMLRILTTASNNRCAHFNAFI